MIQPLESHPLPTDHDAARERFADSPQFEDREVPHPDVLHTEYVTTRSRTHEWHVFTVDLYGFGGWVYVWNHQLGEGVRVPTDEKQFESLAEAVAASLEGSNQEQAAQ